MTAQIEEIVLSEWSEEEIPDFHLSDEALRLCKKLSTRSGPQVEILQLGSGLRIRTFSWIGIIELDSIRLRIEPKLAGKHLNVPKLVDWTSGIDALRKVGSELPIEFEGDNLFDLLVRLLVEETEVLIKAGLRTDYIERQEAIRLLRGRLDIERQIRRQRGRFDQFECRFDDRSSDIPDNQLLLAALDRCSHRIRNPLLRRRANRSRVLLSEACTAHRDGPRADNISYNRLNRHYQPGHHWAKLILDGTRGLESFYRSADGKCFAFLIDMNILFESFVEKALDAVLLDKDLKVRFQSPQGSVIRRASGGPYRRLIPDTILVSPDDGIEVPIDAKYKRYSIKRVDTSDISQTFLYAFGLHRSVSESLPMALIVHPSETGNVDHEILHINGPGQSRLAEISVVGLPVARMLEEFTSSHGSDRPSADSFQRVVTGRLASQELQQ